MNAHALTEIIVSDCLGYRQARAEAMTELTMLSLLGYENRSMIKRRKTLQAYIDRKNAEVATLDKAARSLLEVWVARVAQLILEGQDFRDPSFITAKNAARLCRDAVVPGWTVDVIEVPHPFGEDVSGVARSVCIVDADRLLTEAMLLADTEEQDIWQVQLRVKVGASDGVHRGSTLTFATPKGCDLAHRVSGLEWAILFAKCD